MKREGAAGGAGHEAIEVRGLRKSFPAGDRGKGAGGSVPVLDGVDFSIKRDRFVVLFGPNGSGKTTILKILSRIETADEGSITLRGKQDPGYAVDMVFQNYRESLFPWRTVADNIGFSLELRGVPRRDRDRQVEALLDRLDVTLPLGSYPYQLSGGQQQMTAILRSIISEPELLLLDEPFASLDYETRYMMQDKILNIWERMGCFILFVSHDVWEAVYLADKVVVLSKSPSRVLEVIDIALPRPRSAETRRSEDFFRYKSKVLRIFEQELFRAETDTV